MPDDMVGLAQVIGTQALIALSIDRIYRVALRYVERMPMGPASNQDVLGPHPPPLPLSPGDRARLSSSVVESHDAGGVCP